MVLSEFLFALNQTTSFRFQLPNGDFVPPHFHITEVGMVHKHFIDCGGTERKESVVNFQLWSSDDIQHRLDPQKVIQIIGLCQQRIGLVDTEIEVEHQGETIGKYGLELSEGKFLLSCTQTDCLAKDKCGIREQSETTQNTSSCCDPSSGCC